MIKYAHGFRVHGIKIVTEAIHNHRRATINLFAYEHIQMVKCGHLFFSCFLKNSFRLFVPSKIFQKIILMSAGLNLGLSK